MNKSQYSVSFAGLTSTRLASLASLFLVTLFAASIGIASAGPVTVREFTASISHTSATASGTQSYTVTITNAASSTKKIHSASIVIPSGWTVNNIVTSPTWTISTTSSLIKGTKTTGGTEINSGDSVTFTFDATAPASAGSYEWTTAAYESDNWTTDQFTITSAQPTVTVGSVAPVLGCTDPTADNYNPSATQDDGSCTYSNTGSLTIDTINGGEPAVHCIAGDVTIAGHGVTGQQGGTWHLAIGWGDGSTTTDPTLLSGSLSGATSAFSFSVSHTFTATSTGLYIVLYHSQASGSDGQVEIVNQCIAPPTQGVVTVVKHVINDNGGTLAASDFTLHIGDGNSTTTFSGSESGTDNLLYPGTYTVNEDSVTDYTQTSLTCGDGTATTTDGTVAVVAGKNYTCTLVNDDTAPTTATLTLLKTVINDSGGTATTSDFAVFINDILSSWGIHSLLLPGSYTISEAATSTYTPSVWGTDCATDGTITLAAGDNKTCSITNNDNPGTLTVIKQVINDNGGTNVASDFTMQVTGSGVSTSTFPGSETGTVVTLSAGSYSVDESGPSGYGATASADCSGTIANGETKTCTITNDDGAATLNIVKNTIGADGTFDFTVGNGLSTSTPSVDTTNGVGTSTMALSAGNYDVTENVPDGWTLESHSCEYSGGGFGTTITNGEAISVDPGDEVTCTFTDNATGSDLSLVKSVDDATPDAGQTITYTLTASNAGPGAANTVQVSDVLPAGVSYVSDDSSGAFATSTGIWNIGDLPAASSTVLHITATVTATAGTAVTNSATISEDGGTSDYRSSNDTGSATFTVNTPTPPSTGGGGGGGPGNGPPAGSGGIGFFGQVLGASTTTVPGGGQVLGASTSTCSTPLLRTFMRHGMQNDPNEVKLLQQFLNDEMHSNLPLTGVFGPLTDQAVRNFQAKHAGQVLTPWGLNAPTGFVYLTTQRWINLLYCQYLDIPIPTLVPFSQR